MIELFCALKQFALRLASLLRMRLRDEDKFRSFFYIFDDFFDFLCGSKKGGNMIADKPLERLAALIPSALVLLGARLTVANQFWKSGRAKVEGWNVFDLKDGTYFLFQNEYSLKTPFGDIYLPLPDLWAHAAAIGEHLFPLLLVFGLASRFAALGLLGMTVVIQLIYPGAWARISPLVGGIVADRHAPWRWRPVARSCRAHGRRL